MERTAYDSFMRYAFTDRELASLLPHIERDERLAADPNGKERDLYARRSATAREMLRRAETDAAFSLASMEQETLFRYAEIDHYADGFGSDRKARERTRARSRAIYAMVDSRPRWCRDCCGSGERVSFVHPGAECPDGLWRSECPTCDSTGIRPVKVAA